jgi:hypothetical protein
MVAEHYIVSDTAEKCRVFHWLPTVPYKCNSLTVLYCLLFNRWQGFNCKRPGFRVSVCSSAAADDQHEDVLYAHGLGGV